MIHMLVLSGFGEAAYHDTLTGGTRRGGQPRTPMTFSKVSIAHLRQRIINRNAPSLLLDGRIYSSLLRGIGTGTASAECMGVERPVSREEHAHNVSERHIPGKTVSNSNTRDRSTYHTQLARMGFDQLFALKT